MLMGSRSAFRNFVLSVKLPVLLPDKICYTLGQSTSMYKSSSQFTSTSSSCENTSMNPSNTPLDSVRAIIPDLGVPTHTDNPHLSGKPGNRRGNFLHKIHPFLFLNVHTQVDTFCKRNPLELNPVPAPHNRYWEARGLRWRENFRDLGGRLDTEENTFDFWNVTLVVD